jgi:acetyl esterase/lipase
VCWVVAYRDGARKVLDDIQAAPIAKPDVDESWITVPAEVGDVPVRIVKPLGTTGPLPPVLYVHGDGARRRLGAGQRRYPTIASCASWRSRRTPRWCS